MILKSAQETKQFGKEFAKKVKNGGVILLYGNLGAGKTTFVQGLAEGLGITKRIISPTFIIVRRYELTTKNAQELSNHQYFYHTDLYRTNGDVEEVKEILQNPNNIVTIEWAEKLKELPQKRYQIAFRYIDRNKREIKIEELQ